MKLKNKIAITTLAVFLVAISFLGMLVFTNSKANIEGQVKDHLESVSQITENNIITFLDGQRNKIELIATQSDLTTEELKEMLGLDNSFYDFFIINSSGIVTVSSNPARVGLNRADRSYFINARNKTYVGPVYFALVPREYSISVSTPFHGNVLVGAIKLSYLNKFTQDKTGLGNTGETLLAFNGENNTVVYFSDRRFSNQSIEILSEERARERPIFNALNEEERTFVNMKDYRGVSVIGVTNYVDEVEIGMVTKIDYAEADLSTSELQMMTFIVILIITALMILIIDIISKQVSGEIEDITGKIERVTKGDLEIQLGNSNITEIKGLTDSLNRILATMKLAILRTGLAKTDIGLGEAVKAKEEAQDKYKILYETTSDAIMILEPPTWKFTAGNPAAIKLFNAKDEKEFVSFNPSDLSPKKQPDGKLSSVKAKAMIEKAMKDGSNFFEWVHKKHKGENFNATVLLTRIEEGGKKYLQATVRDVSKEVPVKKK